MDILGGFKSYGELPASDSPWEMRYFCGTLFFLNPDHPPYTVEDGKLTPVEFQHHEEPLMVTFNPTEPSARR